MTDEEILKRYAHAFDVARDMIEGREPPPPLCNMCGMPRESRDEHVLCVGCRERYTQSMASTYGHYGDDMC